MRLTREEWIEEQNYLRIEREGIENEELFGVMDDFVKEVLDLE